MLDPSQLVVVGQAVVTDPLRGRASGYTLVGSSPSVTPGDAQHLADKPQVTDYLHTSEKPGPYVGWHRLPSERWALVRRFTSGQRRGNYHRVVVHALIVPAPVLRVAGDDPWLLLARCRFQPEASGEWRNLTALGAAVEQGLGDLTMGSMPDLVCEAPGDPQQERFEALARRRTFLLEELGAKVLERDLARVFAALGRGERVLLGDRTVDNQLLALAFSALPAVDRLSIGWTTHLATDAAHLFNLANAPDPSAALARLGGEGGWVLGGERGDDGDSAIDAAALARALVTSKPDIRQLWDDFRHDQVSLLSGTSSGVASAVTWLEQGGAEAYRGFATLAELADWLRAQALGPAARCTAEGALAAACGTVRRLTEAGTDLTIAIHEVTRAVDSAGKNDSVLQASAVARLQPHDPGGHGGAGVVIAAALVLERPNLPRHREVAPNDRAVLVRQLAAVEVPPSSVLAALWFARLSALWHGLFEVDSALASIAFQALSVAPDGLKRLASGFVTPDADALPRVLHVFEAATANADREIVADLAGRVLLPAMEDPALSSVLSADKRSRIIDRLSGTVLIDQLADGSNSLFPDLMGSLRRRAHAARPNLAVIVSGVVQRKAGRLRTDRSFIGLTALLHQAGVPEEAWLPFALAEAHMLDQGADQDARQAFRQLLEEQIEIPAEASGRWSSLVLGHLRKACHQGQLKVAHLAVLTATSAGLAKAGEQAVAGMIELLQMETVTVLFRVAPAAITVAENLDSTVPALACELRLAVWHELASTRHRWNEFPPDLVRSFDQLSVTDRRSVARAFAPKLGWLGDDPGNRALHVVLEQAGTGDVKFAERKKVVAVATTGGSLMPTVLALRKRQAAPEEILRTLRAELPRSYAEKVRAIMPLLWSSLAPVERNVIEGPLLQEAIRQAKGSKWIQALLESVPEAKKLEKSSAVTVLFAARVGKRWRDDVDGAHGFLKLLIDSEIYGAVTILLTESESRSGGLLPTLLHSPHPPLNLLRTLRSALDDREHGQNLNDVRALVRKALKGI